jgi:tRNA-dependent cyclodipeptide synthase
MKYYNVTQEEIDRKMFNIFVGISLGNKLLTPELVKHYVKWVHKNTKDNAVILIADEIDKINWKVFRGLSDEEAAEKVRNKSYDISGMFEKAKRELYREENDPTYITKIHTIFWENIKNTGYENLRKIIEDQYLNNLEFKKDVLCFVDKYVKVRNVEVDVENKDKLAQYILDELPTLIGGIYWDNTLYNLILYPTYVDSGMSEFVVNVRNGKYFNASILELRQICLLVEDYIEKQK